MVKYLFNKTITYFEALSHGTTFQQKKGIIRFVFENGREKIF